MRLRASLAKAEARANAAEAETAAVKAEAERARNQLGVSMTDAAALEAALEEGRMAVKAVRGEGARRQACAAAADLAQAIQLANARADSEEALRRQIATLNTDVAKAQAEGREKGKEVERGSCLSYRRRSGRMSGELIELQLRRL